MYLPPSGWRFQGLRAIRGQGRSMKSLHHIHSALQAETLQVGNRTAAMAALDLLATLHDRPLAALDLEAPKFALAYPRDRVPDIARPAFKGGLQRYRMFRNTILDCQMIADPGDVDGAPWSSLRRVARLCLSAGENPIYGVTSVLPEGITPADVTRDFALSIDMTLEGTKRTRFRRGLRIVDDLHDHDLARRTGLLPPERFGRLPKATDLAAMEPLPPKLRALRDAAPRSTRNAIHFFWRLAVVAGVFRQSEDPSLHDLCRRYPDVATLDPSEFGLALHERKRRIYLTDVAGAMAAAGCRDPRVSPPGAAWRALKRAVRAVGAKPERLNVVAAAAMRDGLGPADLTSAWFAKRLAQPQQMATSAFRMDAVLLDAFRGDDRIPQALLPAEPTAVKRLRRPRGAPKPPPAPRPKTEGALWVVAWIDLFAAARAHGYSSRRLHPLYALKTRAIAAELGPRHVTVGWIVALMNTETCRNRSAIFRAMRLLDEFRDSPDLAPFAPKEKLTEKVVADRRDRPPLSSTMMADLNETLEAMGAANSTRREAAAAVKALVEVSEDRLDLGQLLGQELGELDWGPFKARAKAYILVLDRLRTFRQLPWTEKWMALQRVVVEAGVPMSQNPVPRLLPYAKGREPHQLDTSWAAIIDRNLRSTLQNPPHGRADLALTFTNHICRLDALHDIGAVATSGLLPPRIGAYRTRQSV